MSDYRAGALSYERSGIRVIGKNPGPRGFCREFTTLLIVTAAKGAAVEGECEVKYSKAAAVVAGSVIALGAAGAAASPAFAGEALPLGNGPMKILDAKDEVAKTGLKAVTGKTGELLGGAGKTGGTKGMIGGLPIGG